MSPPQPRSTQRTPYVLIGAGGHAKVIIDILERSPAVVLLGLLDSQRAIGEHYAGHAVLGREEHISHLSGEHPDLHLIIAVGHNWHRSQIALRLRQRWPDIRFGTAIHPAAILAKTAQIGPGTVIMAGAIIGPDTRVGEHCIVNHASSVDHDSTLENYCSLAPGVVTGGLVKLEEGCAINTGATIGRGRRIGAHAVIGAGATVVADIPARVLAFGTPAKTIRARSPEDDYF